MESSNTICGYIVITSEWFDDDCIDPDVKSFWIKSKDGNVIYDKSLRRAWELAIQPQYVNRNSSSIFSYFDLKSNPRRVHPFATTFEDWFCREIYSYLNGTQKMLPVLILRPCRICLVGYWRNGLDSDMLLKARKCVIRTSSVHTAAKRIQVWWRKYKT